MATEGGVDLPRREVVHDGLGPKTIYAVALLYMRQKPTAVIQFCIILSLDGDRPISDDTAAARADEQIRQNWLDGHTRDFNWSQSVLVKATVSTLVQTIIPT